MAPFDPGMAAIIRAKLFGNLPRLDLDLLEAEDEHREEWRARDDDDLSLEGVD